ncbi:MAG: DNA polymerase III subunit delta' [Candidatus Omnitrophica bacterium]|nr:DNA polymerase III subunit delta' [Candidatus Omnitrophota bacterium]
MFSPKLVDQEVLSQLHKQIETKQWATTYLFTGKELVRKRALAIAFAKALNCERAGSGASCSCTSCKKIDAGTHPDIKWYGTDEEANSIKIAEVRDFKNWLNLKSFEAKVKVFIFDQAERLTSEAQNALLKSIEEPPPGNVIIFLVPNLKSLFDTISSRSVEIKVPPFETKAIKSILVQEGIEEKEAEFLARASQGELSAARKAHEAQWFRDKNLWIDALEKDPVQFLEQFHGATRGEISKVIGFLVEWFRDLLVYQAGQDEESLIHMDRASLIESIVARHDFDSVMEAFDALNQFKRSLEDYANQKLVLTETEVLLERFFKL